MLLTTIFNLSLLIWTVGRLHQMVSKVPGDDFRGSQELISTGHLHTTLPSFLTSQASASSPTLHTIYYNQGTRKEGASVLLSLADEGGTWGEGLTRGTDGENGACPLCPSIPPTAQMPGKFTESLQTPFVTKHCMEPSITPLIYPCHFPVESRPASSQWHFLSHPLDEDFI